MTWRLALLVALFVALCLWLGWAYDHVPAPTWCDGWMAYTRSCIGWTMQR